MSEPYSLAGFRRLLYSDAVTPATREALSERLNRQPKKAPDILTPEQFAALKALTGRLVPQDDTELQADIVGGIDDRLKAGESKGWRYDLLPPEKLMYAKCLYALDRAAEKAYNAVFCKLPARKQETLITQLQDGKLSGLDPEESKRFFEEVLAISVEIFYAHPVGRVQTGDRSFADVPGWSALDLGSQDSQEMI